MTDMGVVVVLREGHWVSIYAKFYIRRVVCDGIFDASNNSLWQPQPGSYQGQLFLIFITLRVVCFVYTFLSVTSSKVPPLWFTTTHTRKSKWHFARGISLVNYKHNIRFTSILFSLVQLKIFLKDIFTIIYNLGVLLMFENWNIFFNFFVFKLLFLSCHQNL